MKTEPNFDILKIDTNPISLRIISDIYVVYNYKKYLPTIDFLELKKKQRFSMYVGATSIATFFENLRDKSNGVIIDYEIWIQKENDDKFAKYIIAEK